MTSFLLFEPIQIGGVQLANRIVFSPVQTGYEENGVISSRSLAFYKRLARGGVGLVVLGNCSVQPSMSPAPAIFDDRFLPGLRELCATVHAEGTKISAQLCHQALDIEEISSVARIEGREAAALRLREDLSSFVNRISPAQIHRFQGRFVAAAHRAKAAGFDLLQIQGDGLLGAFCSPEINKRTDEYGGTLEKCLRFAVETVLRVQKSVSDLAIDYKLAIGGSGPSLEDARSLAQWLVKAGVSTIHVTQAGLSGLLPAIPPAGAAPSGCFADLAASIKTGVNVPVSTVGRIVRPELAESILEQGKADLICLARALIADPDWPAKVFDGREAEIRECIMCNHCADAFAAQSPITCTINAQTGPGVEMDVAPVSAPRRILVVGGGPAGMEAARVASLRGHSVTIFEKTRSLGGQLKIAATPAYQEEMKRILTFLMRAMARQMVEIRFRLDATPQEILNFAPDQVILAVGSKHRARLGGPDHPDSTLPGSDGANVVDAWDVLAGQAKAGERVIILGGDRIALDAAAWVASKGSQVIVVDELEDFGRGISPSRLPFLRTLLQELKVEFRAGCKVQKIVPEGVILLTGNRLGLVACDTVILSDGIRTPDQELAQVLSAAGIPFLAAGDCAGETSHWLLEAIHDGFRAGREV